MVSQGKLGPYELNSIMTGDARELAKEIPDNSVDLIFTDPVYDRIDDYRWLAETAARVLKPDSACLVWHGNKQLADVIPEMRSFLTYQTQFIMTRPSGLPSSFVHYRVMGNFRSCLWFTKGKGWPERVISDLTHASTTNILGHRWQKDPRTLLHYINGFTQPGDIVADFFCGGGTVPAVAKMLGINYWACELDPATANKARQRVALTQAPLFVLQPEQMTLLQEAK